MKLPREFYVRENTIQIARELLGKLLVVPAETGERVSGMIVEVEAYMGVDDRAAHSYGGRRTKRTETMYAIGGTVYIFFIYGMYYQLNFVTGPEEQPHAILIRAIEPVEGIELMRERRGKMKDGNLTSGPGKLCIAMSIDKTANGKDLLGEEIWLENYKRTSSKNIASGKRIGIDYAGTDAEKPWRFWVKDSPFVSR